MKKFLLSVILGGVLFTLAACGSSASNNAVETVSNDEVAEVVEENVKKNSTFKMGAVLIGDENEGYTYAHIEGIVNALKENGLSEKDIIWKYSIPESEVCHDACVDLAESGCTLIITNSYSHQSYCQEAAEEYPDIEFVSMTGDTARKANLPNFHNAFTKIYEARFVGGVVAGMKIKELVDNGKLTDKNYKDGKVKIGYVGAFPYAEVVSGYTGFFLGVRSVFPDVCMDVQYTNSWFDITGENEAATKMLSDGCVIISQHADSTGAPSAVEEYFNAGNTCYCVGYNIDMLSVAPNTALTSPKNNWKNYYTYIIDAVKNGNTFDMNWAEGYEEDSVGITKLGSACAPGTAEKVKEVEEKFKNGELKVFDTDAFTVGGEKVTHAFATDSDGDFNNDCDEAIFDGCYNESYFQSAPSFSLRIDGITELN